jgi:hypothetical protein
MFIAEFHNPFCLNYRDTRRHELMAADKWVRPLIIPVGAKLFTNSSCPASRSFMSFGTAML